MSHKGGMGMGKINDFDELSCDSDIMNYYKDDPCGWLTYIVGGFTTQLYCLVLLDKST